MTYNEATRLARLLDEKLNPHPSENYRVDENDGTIYFPGGWLSFEQLRWLAAQLPVEERDNEA